MTYSRLEKCYHLISVNHPFLLLRDKQWLRLSTETSSPLDEAIFILEATLLKIRVGARAHAGRDPT